MNRKTRNNDLKRKMTKFYLRKSHFKSAAKKSIRSKQWKAIKFGNTKLKSDT